MIAEFLARVRSLWRSFRRPADVHTETTEEFRHHLELRTEDLIRQGVPSDRASRQARLEFGHIESHKQDARASRGLKLFDEIGFYWLDAKLGLRMLKKYPGLSIVSIVGMAVAIAIAAGGFGAIGSVLDPSLPLDEGDRIVTVQNERIGAPGSTILRNLQDFFVWRDELTQISEVGAYITRRRNLSITGRGIEPVWLAEMSASGFRVAPIAPVLGRGLVDDDEHAGAPPVIVIGHDAWQRRFAGDSNVVGTQVEVGGESHTVVGVMPQSYRFPFNHGYWVPFKLDPNDYGSGNRPVIRVFGRLGAGATLDNAQAELTSIGLSMAALYPDTHAHLHPRVYRYNRPLMDVDDPAVAWGLRAAQLGTSLLMIVVAVNVAVLMYARTVTRTDEIAVRTALGASRRRIVTQLFTEALVLSVIAAGIGLPVAGAALAKAEALLQAAWNNDLPFWWHLDLSAGLIVYVAGLAVLGSVIVGVLPALKATGSSVQTRLQHLSARGSGMQLGRTWSALIVIQVAVSVAALPFAGWVAGVSIHRARFAPEYASGQILRAGLWMERQEAPPATEEAAYAQEWDVRFLDRATRLVRRMEAEPAVSGVTFADTRDGDFERFEPEGGASQWVSVQRVDVDYLSVFDVPILAGRAFLDADTRDGARGVIVNQVLAERMFGAGSAIARRIRLVGGHWSEQETGWGPWLEIVGVVPDFTAQVDVAAPHARLYEPVTLEEIAPGIVLSVRVAGTPGAALAARMREVTADVDPALLLNELTSAADEHREAGRTFNAIALGVSIVVLSVVLLSGAGVYAMMSFTVARRRREIAIRSALGADPRRLLTGIFARASTQLGLGVVCGLVLAAALQGPLSGKGLILLPIVGFFMTAVGLLATLGPARSGLAIHPTEALREE